MWVYEKYEDGAKALVELYTGATIRLNEEAGRFCVEIKHANGSLYSQPLKLESREEAENWVQKLAHRLNALDLNTLDVVVMPERIFHRPHPVAA